MDNLRRGSKVVLGMAVSLMVISGLFYFEIPIQYFEYESVNIIQNTKNTISEYVDKIIQSDIYNNTITEISNIEISYYDLPKINTPITFRTGLMVNHTNIEYYIWNYTNQNRLDNGLSELARVSEIDDISRAHSKDMFERRYFAHYSPDGHGPSDRSDFAGYSCIKNQGSFFTEGLAENIARHTTYHSYSRYVTDEPISYDWHDNGESLALEIVDGWMDSQRHRENILNSQYDRLGVGVYIAPNDFAYITQNFC